MLTLCKGVLFAILLLIKGSTMPSVLPKLNNNTDLSLTMNYYCHLCQKTFVVTTLISALMSLNVKASIAIEQLNFKDGSLSNCITTLAKKHNWQTIETIKKLQCHGMHIKNLDGLEALTALEYLSLYNNEIKSDNFDPAQ